ncbi:GNAT family N-acetyltransferase [Sporomusa sp.]|uniref:GNAT family N-acetyltransferase n=1 Tax=Sporomusa sp. TaxID=2078658 RepID=UPI002CD528E0|nr:GNAT family N-acetyltransferase [Sporomusa sp.]HWR44286.1 GNAT family N-acetyltransferase [Sporomusa sp.]
MLTEQDRAQVLKYLDRYSFGGAFLVGNVLGFGLENHKDKRRCGDYYGYFSKGELLGILPFYNMGSCIPVFEEEKEVIASFTDIMRKRQFQVLIGMQKFIKPLYEAISAEKEVVSYQESSYFVNKHFTPLTLENTIFTDASEIDKNEAVEFIRRAYWEGFHHEYTPEETRKVIEQRGAEEEYLFLMVDGKIVAQAYIQAVTDTINQIGGVFTLGEERSKRYGKAIVAELCRRIIARGKIPTLSVSKDNTPAVKAYVALGFSHHDDYLIIKYKV